MRNDLRTLFQRSILYVATSLLCLPLTGCLDAMTYDKCTAQTGSLSNGKGGGAGFPGEMLKSQCEKKCAPIRKAAIAEPTWGYCRFGNDYLWEENRDTEAAEQMAFMEDVQERFDAAMHPRSENICTVDIYNSGDFNDVHEEWESTRSAYRCKKKCKPYMAKARSLGASAECHFNDDLVSSVDTALGENSDLYE